MAELGFRAKRRERRMMFAKFAAGALGIFMVGYGVGWVTHRVEVIKFADGATPVSCVTLAIYPNEFLPKPNEVTINVKNGSLRIGMASITAEVMRTRGFKVQDVGNYKTQDIKEPVRVIFGDAGHDAALLVAAYIAGANLVNDGRASAIVDVVVGQDFKQVRSKAQAQEEMSRPVASPSGPGC